MTAGVRAGAYGNAMLVRSGAVLSNACMMVIGNNHAYWGGGSGGRLFFGAVTNSGDGTFRLSRIFEPHGGRL